MVEIEIDESKGVATLRPTPGQSLTEEDIGNLKAMIDGYLASHETLQGMVVVADYFPGWDSLSAFLSHLKLVREHEKEIDKIAVVSDNGLLHAMPSIADHFVKAKIRNFATSELAQAQEWVATKDPREGQFVVLDGYADDVVALKAEGRITSADYEETLIPLAEAAINAHSKVKLLYWCGEEFTGFSAGAAWDDARFGMANMSKFSKIAFVTDIGWMRESVKMFGPLLPGAVQVFDNGDIEKAKTWISGD
jgi:stage II sporulation SpoAA-like protein